MLGPYQLLRRIGQGGMGAVYEAEHPTHRAYYAVKLLHPHYSEDEIMVERLRREAMVSSRLRHANIVYVADYGTDPELGFYLVMEMLRGEGLNTVLEREPVLPLFRVVEIVYQLCDALHHAHGLGVIHRDLKPGNVFLEETVHDYKQVKIVDFGIAHLLGPQGESQRQLTQAGGKSMGTPEYMPPEQILAKNSEIGPQTDLYALAVMIFRMLTGSLPFKSNSFVGLLNQVMYKSPPMLHMLRPEFKDTSLEGLLFRCMAKSPKNRLKDVNAFRKQFQYAIDQDPKIPALMHSVTRSRILSSNSDASTVGLPRGTQQGDLETKALDTTSDTHSGTKRDTQPVDQEETDHGFPMEKNQTFIFAGQTFRFDGEKLIEEAPGSIEDLNRLLNQQDATLAQFEGEVKKRLAKELPSILDDASDLPTAILSKPGKLSAPSGQSLGMLGLHDTNIDEGDELDQTLADDKMSPFHRTGRGPSDLSEGTIADQLPKMRPPTEIIHRPKSLPKYKKKRSKLSAYILGVLGGSLLGVLILVVAGYMFGLFPGLPNAQQQPDAGQQTQDGSFILTITTKPPGAWVVVQGKRLGQTPLRLKQTKGKTLDFILKKKDYELRMGTWSALKNESKHFTLSRSTRQ